MTGDLPEPSSRAAFPGAGLRASDADREQVLTLLSTAYAEGRLDADEHEDRLHRAMVAKTFGELVPITQDLVAAAQWTSPVAAPAPEVQVDTRGAAAEADHMVAVFGSVNRHGRWRIRRTSQVLALFGGVELDLREAVFEHPVVEINGFWCFGGMEIKVPAGMEVREHVVGIFGGTDISHLGERRADAPVLVIKGLALFGGVTVKGPKVRRVRRR